MARVVGGIEVQAHVGAALVDDAFALHRTNAFATQTALPAIACGEVPAEAAPARENELA